MSQTSLEAKYTSEERQHETHHIAVPASLVGLSEAERESIRASCLRKIDIMVIPSITLMYILNYLDRQNISAAKLDTIVKDLKLTAVQYQMCISFLFLGYILFQIPSNMVAGKVSRPAQYICAGMAAWGCVSTATAAVHNFTGLVVCRAILGVTEAVFFPGALYYLSTFYTRKHMAMRTALMYCGSQLGNAFGGLFAAAILKMKGVHGLSGWRWLFIIEGAATVGIAIMLAFQLPNSPQTARWITEQERDSLIHDLKVEAGASDNRGEISTMQGLKMALSDPKLYLLCGILFCTYISAAVVNFFPSVVATLGYSRNKTLLLTAPPYLLCCITMMINGWHSDKKQERFLHIVIPLGIAMVAFVIAVSTLNTAARYVSMMLMPTSLYSASIVILSWITGSIQQPAVKRAIAIGIINATCNSPNIWTPYLYKAPPRYLNAFALNLAAAAVAIAFACATRFYLARKNRELDQGINTARGGPTDEQVANGYRYVL
ncbi:putative MFS transporter [Meredithblackwellia eburnea MCA 4105]